VTNNSANTVGEQEAALATIGIPATGDVLTSALAAAVLVEPGERVLVCGGAGVIEAVEARGCTVVSSWPCDAVMVGFHRNFDYDGLCRAATAAHLGARLIGTNDDASYPTPDGPIPGGGAILAAVSVGSGVAPVVAGKPYGPMAELVRLTVGAQGAAGAVMIGDRPTTDGRFATELSCRYAQVWSGVTPRGTVVDPAPFLTAERLSDVVDRLLT